MQVSVVSLGTWLTYGGSAAQDHADECTRRAHELGVNFFDTANRYQNGQAEEVLGKALARIPRDTYLVGTKVCNRMADGPLGRGLSRKHIFGQIDHSLRRLGMDYVDLYQCHRFDPDAPLEETARAMSDLVQMGKILYWGVSEWPVQEVRRVVRLCRSEGWAIPVSEQSQYSAIWRSVEDEKLSHCGEAGLGFLAFCPLAMGVLAGKYRADGSASSGDRGSSADGWVMSDYLEPGVLRAVEAFRDVARAAGCSPANLALAWCLRRPEVSSVITGASRLAQLEENVRAAELDIDTGVLQRVSDLFAPVAVG
ncbi:aldo/keto reductase family protein [Amycolatopsis thermoflava]|uniref:aldo/keto reductase family protein n=1 Tax=Amycolatopsis thermoflava TaxID=84480 RepID=UPI00366377E9